MQFQMALTHRFRDESQCIFPALNLLLLNIHHGAESSLKILPLGEMVLFRCLVFPHHSDSPSEYSPL